jgi:hypothetical protein
MTNTRIATVVSIVAGVACTRSTELIDDGSIPGLVAIDVIPATTTIDIDDVTAHERLELTAVGRFESGETRDVTSLVTWTVDNRSPGDFVGPGVWESSNRAGGPVAAVARAGDVSGDGAIEVYFRPRINDDNYPPPPGAPPLFDTVPTESGVPDRSPAIAYPAHQVMFPINVDRVLFQFDPAGTSDVYRLRFESTYLDMQVFTTNDRWQADATTWSYMALTAAGGKASMTVAGIDSTDPIAVWQSEAIALHFAEAAVQGVIYYWSSSAEGVLKGRLADPAPTRFYTQPPEQTCVGCHTVSRDGTRLAVGYDGEVLQSVTIPDREVVIPSSRGYGAGWSTFSPDSRLLLVADRGQLRLLEADTGDAAGGDGLIDLDGLAATHPDWSPRGDSVAVAVCTNAGNNKDVDGCAIGRLPFNGGSWGPVEILVPSTGPGDNNFFPRYSPDGRWLAYVHASGKSKDQKTATLHVIPAAGGTPVALAAANRRVGTRDDLADAGNTMPTWAPSTRPGIQWLAFSSVRDYGKVLAGEKADQIWIAGLDLDRAARGDDPSYAAFWLPLQEVSERNHRAFWAVDSVVECVAAVEVCDGYDNDCDAVIDDDCLPCLEEEVCVDGIDNDCDGAIDNGCVD